MGKVTKIDWRPLFTKRCFTALCIGLATPSLLGLLWNDYHDGSYSGIFWVFIALPLSLVCLAKGNAVMSKHKGFYYVQLAQETFWWCLLAGAISGFFIRQTLIHLAGA